MNKVFNAFLSFTGRAKRLRFFLGVYVAPLISLLLCAIAFALGSTILTFNMSSLAFRICSAPFFLASLIFFLFLLISPLSFIVRRLHDLNFNGWWIFAIWGWHLIVGVGYGLIYSICCPPAAMNSTDQIGLLATFVITALVSIPHLLLLFVPGDKGPNRFGDETTDGYTVTL